MTYHQNDLKNETVVNIQTCKKMLLKPLKTKDFEEMWAKSNEFFKPNQVKVTQNKHSFLSKENKIKVMKEQKLSSMGRRLVTPRVFLDAVQLHDGRGRQN